MPQGNGTGPRGMGPMTGRAAGYCAGFSEPGFVNSGAGFAGRGPGRGGGFGGGRRRGRFCAPGYAAPWIGMAAPVVEPTPADQARALKQQADYLEQSLAEIKQRLAELEEA
jgi:uncharacterized protein DUF5320